MPEETRYTPRLTPLTPPLLQKNDSDKQTGSDEDEEEGRTGGIFVSLTDSGEHSPVPNEHFPVFIYFQKLFGKGRKKQSTPNKKPKSNGSNHDTAEEIKK